MKNRVTATENIEVLFAQAFVYAAEKVSYGKRQYGHHIFPRCVTTTTSTYSTYPPPHTYKG